MAHAVDLRTARAIWFARQGLATPKRRAPAQLLADTGWFRTFGGNAYLSARARLGPKSSRTDLEAAVFTDDATIMNVPSVHSCVMLVPDADVPLSLAAARPGIEKDVAHAASKCDFTLDEIDALGDAVMSALGDGPRAPNELRDVLGDRVRSLGEAGKKIGESSTLTVTLKRLAAAGRIQRLAAGDRLDSSRLRYARVAEPKDPGELATDAQARATALVDRYLRWAAPATLDEIAKWTDAGKRRVQTALADLGVDEVAVEGLEGTCFAHAKDPFLAEKPATPRQEIVLLPADDNLFGLRSPTLPLLDPTIHGVELDGKALADHRWWHVHLVVRHGEVIGAWEWDHETGDVAWGVFGTVSKAVRGEIGAAAAGVARFIGAELGEIKMSSIDTAKRRAKRVEVVRGLG